MNKPIALLLCAVLIAATIFHPWSAWRAKREQARNHPHYYV